MSAGEQLSEVRTQVLSVPQVNATAQKPEPNRPSVPPGQATRRNEVVITGLRKAMEELVKAQDHLHMASDQVTDAVSTAIAGIIRNVRGIQREVSNVMHNVSCAK